MFFLSSFIFFNFLVLLIEFFVIAGNGGNFQIKFFVETRVYKFYIFFVAFYSICFQAFLLLEYWFHKPENKITNRKVRKFVIWDRRAFQHGFLLWVFRLFIFTTLFAYDGIFNCLNLFENYKYLLILLGFVLFLDLFIGLRKVFKINILKIIALFSFFVFLSFLYILLRPYDDAAMLNYRNNGINSRELALPNLDLKEKSYIESFEHIYYTSKGDLRLNFTNKPLTKTNFSHYLKDYGLHRIPKPIYLYIDKYTSMKDFNEIKLEMMKADKLRVNIAFYSTLTKCQANAQYLTLGFPPYGFYEDTSSLKPPPPPPFDFENKFADSSIVNIKYENGFIHYKHSNFTLTSLDSLIYSDYSNKNLIRLHYSGETTFQEYLELYLAIKNGIYKRRDQLAFKETGFSYLELRDKENYKKLYRSIREDVPFYLDERQF